MHELAEVAPVVTEYEPEGQGVQLGLPAATAKKPGEQATQMVASMVLDDVPGGQGCAPGTPPKQ